MKRSPKPRGLPIAIDPQAESASHSEPAFIARPDGAPVYYGFPILEDVSVEDFRLGVITDFELEGCEEGDAFVVAPDDSRAGLVWQVSQEPLFRALCPPEKGRWGVWEVSFPLPMTSRAMLGRICAACCLS